jgi:hypothetical protein
MKKETVLIALLLSLLLIVSCSTSVKVQYLEPAEVDLGQARTIAIASTVPYNGRTGSGDFVRFSNFSDPTWFFYSSASDSYLKGKVANYATDMLYGTLNNSGYFNILDPSATDSILSGAKAGYDVQAKLKEKGVKVVIIPKITGMSVDEYIYRKEYTKKVVNPTTHVETTVRDYHYYLSQSVTINYEYSIVSVEHNAVIVTKRFTRSAHDDRQINHYASRSDYDLYSMYCDCLRSFKSTILDQLVPLGHTYTIDLMSNKPKVKALEPAYKAVDDGNLSYGRDAFRRHYEKNGDLVSGYNAAIVAAAMGDFDSAIAELNSLYYVYPNERVAQQLNRLLDFRAQNDKAKSQIQGTSEGFKIEGSGNIYAQMLGF